MDILEDAGQSLSPLVDIGQVEGAFIMGLGWWLTEELVYDTSNGALLTDNTWVIIRIIIAVSFFNRLKLSQSIKIITTAIQTNASCRYS